MGRGNFTFGFPLYYINWGSQFLQKHRSTQLSKLERFKFNVDKNSFDNIFNSSPILQKLANVNKNDFLKKVNQNYLNKIKKILSDLN